MTFSLLAQYFKKLESTPSRNAMTEILAQLFKNATKDEIGKICYLLQGRVAPLYEPIEFGVADKFVIRAIAQAYGVDGNNVTKIFKKLGDLGLAAEAISQQSLAIDQKKNMSVADVYRLLYTITQKSGEGSQEKKITILAELLKDADALSARYIARIPLDKLRLGFSDMTMLDSLSFLLAGDKSLRSKLEDAYNVRPDIGWLAQQIKNSNVNIQNFQASPKLGTPILPALCQRLPNADEMIKKMGRVAVEPKYDGVRCVGGYTGLFIKERGYISARDVHEGDFVLTHKGRFKKIIAVSKRHKRKGEALYRLQTMLGDACTISGDHPVLLDKKGIPTWTPVNQLSSTDWLIFPKVQRKTGSIGRQLILEDGAGYTKSIPWSNDFFRFLGFWVGDGFSNNSHQSERVGLTFNAKTEKTLATAYERIIRQTLKIRIISRNERNGGLNIYWRDPVFRVWLCKEFRYDDGGDHGKCLPDWMYRISRQQFLAFMKGWEEADGASQHGGGNRITTKEHRLAQKAVLLGSLFRFPIGVRKARIALQSKIIKTYYELILPGTDRYIHELTHSYAVKIRSIERAYIHPKSHLYDFEIEGDQSFCTSLAALHNCQIHVSNKEIKTFSRNLENTTLMFPELSGIGKQINAYEVILDGEAIGVDPATGKLIPFQETMSRKRKHDIEATRHKIPLKFFIFDILYRDGKELLDMALSDRRKLLEQIVKNGAILTISPQIVTDSAQVIRRYHDEQLARGLEGAVVKTWDSPYEPGRTGYSWVKFKEEEGKTGKLTDTIDAVVMGYYKGQGKRTGFGIGMFLVGVRSGDGFVTVTKIGTGVSDRLWKEFRVKLEKIKTKEQPKEYVGVHKLFTPDIWVLPKIVVEIAGDDLTKSPSHGAGVAVRFPRLVRIRSDKSSGQATTVDEVTKMYHNQTTSHS